MTTVARASRIARSEPKKAFAGCSATSIPGTLGWTSQPARAVDQRFIKDDATIYVQPTSNGASLVALGRDNPLGNQLREKFGERVNRSAYGNGLVSDRVQVSEQELREFFGAPAGVAVAPVPQIALLQSPA